MPVSARSPEPHHSVCYQCKSQETVDKFLTKIEDIGIFHISAINHFLEHKLLCIPLQYLAIFIY